MAKEVKSWEAEDGSLHKSECAAATRDVELLVERSPLQENTPFAKKLVDWLTANAGEIRKTFEAHERACPKAVAAEPPAESEHASYCQSRGNPDLDCDCGDTDEDVRGEMIHHGC